MGDFSKGVQAVYQQLKKNEMKQVQLELFDGARHDLLHEEQSGAAQKAIKKVIDWIMSV